VIHFLPLMLLTFSGLGTAGGRQAELPPAGDWAATVAALAGEQRHEIVFAEKLRAQVPPAELARVLLSNRELAAVVMGRLGSALDQAAPGVEEFLVAGARALGREVAGRGPPWREEDIDLLVSAMLVEPPARSAVEQPLRPKVLELLPKMLDPAVPGELRDRLLERINQTKGVDFEASEQIELGWGTALRSSATRRVPYQAGQFRLPNPQGPILTSLYSLPSSFFTPDQAERFLAAVEQWRPEREILVLLDLPLRLALASRRSAHTRLIETYGRGYTPWPRDPLLLARRQDGGVVILQRSFPQPWRAEDADMGRELIQGLPLDVDQAWKRAQWAMAPVPFHNGQVLLTESACWITIHTVEAQALEILGLKEVPVSSFATDAGIDRYLAAVRTAVAELERLYSRPARFVHPLPGPGPTSERSAAMERLGGGAGFDLDSYLTLLPRRGDSPTALVADLGSGRELLSQLEEGDWQRLRGEFGLARAPAQLRQILDGYQATARGQRFTVFLDEVAKHLSDQGLPVERLPQLLVPTDLLEEKLDYPDFQLTWNNVVVETSPHGMTAEGFSNLVERGDDQARRIFERAGCQLKLLPPLIPSILHNGGYRCASNHLRASKP